MAIPGIYTTSEIAKLIGVHPNTVRLYEKLKLIPQPERLENNYRVFTDVHVEQFRLARAALQIEIIQNGLRKKAIDIIRTSAAYDFEKAEAMAKDYLSLIESEKRRAGEAIEIAKHLFKAADEDSGRLLLTRKQAADYLNITIDTLRNWELNGLITTKRKLNGYRVYDDHDIGILKIIRTLRFTNYSLSAILRILIALKKNPLSDIKKIIDTPMETEEVVTACDKLLTSLDNAWQNTQVILIQIDKINKLYTNPPL